MTENPHDSFYDSFLNDVINYKHNKQSQLVQYLKIAKFREFLIQKRGLSYETIKLCAEGMRLYMNKPQRVLVTTDLYYVGIDLYTNMYYICYKNVLMIDIDRLDCLDEIKGLMNSSTDSYRVYKSNNGFHIFVTNRYFDYKNKETIDYLISFGADVNYIICCYIRGFSVRISKKKVEEPDNLYELIYEHKPESNDVDIIQLIDYKKDLIKMFGKNILF